MENEALNDKQNTQDTNNSAQDAQSVSDVLKDAEERFSHLLEREQNIIHIALEDIRAMRYLFNNFAPEDFMICHRTLVKAMWEAYEKSGRTARLTRTAFRYYLIHDLHIKGDVFTHLTVFDKCSLGRYAVYDDLITLVQGWDEQRIKRAVDESFQIFNKEQKTGDFGSAVDHLVNRLGETIQYKQRTTVRPLLDDLDLYIANYNNLTRIVYPCGLKPLDAVIHGIGLGEMLILFARLGGGKSAFKQMWCEYAALYTPVLNIILEGAPDAYKRRCLNRHTKFSAYAHVMDSPTTFAKIPEPVRKEIQEQARAVYSVRKPIYNVFHVHTLSEILSTIEYYHEVKGVNFVTIDYVQKIVPDVCYKSKHENLTEISQRLQECASKNNVALLCLAQGNRDMTTDTKKQVKGEQGQVGVEHIRGSDQFAMDADTILALHERDNDGNKAESGITYLKVLKVREGPLPDNLIPLEFVKHKHTFLPADEYNAVFTNTSATTNESVTVTPDPFEGSGLFN